MHAHPSFTEHPVQAKVVCSPVVAQFARDLLDQQPQPT